MLRGSPEESCAANRQESQYAFGNEDRLKIEVCFITREVIVDDKLRERRVYTLATERTISTGQPAMLHGRIAVASEIS